jgi:hypothetical protein
MRLIPGPSERSQIPHHRLVLGGNQGVGTVTCSYCHQMGHLFNCCPFVDDRLKQLLREEVMNIHQLVFPTTIIVVPNVSVLGTQAMNLSIGHMIVLVNYQTIWSQPITPIVLGQTSMIPTSTYPMWYNVIPLFMPLDPNLYPIYQIGAKGLDSLLEFLFSFILEILVKKDPFWTSMKKTS